MAESPFSAPICASTALASAIEEATPEGRPSQFEIWADAAFRTALSPPLPQNALLSLKLKQLMLRANGGQRLLREQESMLPP